MDYLPHDIEAEESLVSSILIDPTVITTSLPIVMPEDIYIIRLRYIYETFLSLLNKNSPIDYTTVMADLSAKKKLEEVGKGYILELLQKPVLTYNAESYAETVSEYSLRRKNILAMQEGLKQAYDTSRPFEVGKTVESMLRNTKNSARRTWQENLSRWWDWYSDKISNPRELSGVSTGIPGIDAMTDGFEPGTSIIFSGMQKLGKSILCDQIALNVARQYRGAIIYTLEISDTMIVNRFISNLSGVTTVHIKRGKVNDFEQYKIADAYAKLEKDYGLDIVNDPKMTTAGIRSDIMRRRAQGKDVNLIVVDYLDLLADPPERGEADLDRQLRCMRNLSALSKELQIICLIVHTLNKDKVISGRQGIKYACDIAISMYQTEGPQFGDPKRYVTLEVTDIRDQPDSGHNKCDLIRQEFFPYFDDVTEMHKPA